MNETKTPLATIAQLLEERNRSCNYLRNYLRKRYLGRRSSKYDETN